MKDKKISPNFLLLTLEHILLQCKGQKELTIGTLVHALGERGYPIIIILFSFPFCLPVTIPGVSTLFGIAIAFMGLKITLGNEIWLPAKIMEKNIPVESLEKIVNYLMKVVRFLQPITHARMVFFIKNPFFHRFNGMVIILMALFLALPLPIPFTNTFSALPILLIALGLLEDDGLFVVLGYLFALICIIYFGSLFSFIKYLFDQVF